MAIICNVLALLAGLWSITGGLESTFHGGMAIVTGLIRM